MLSDAQVADGTARLDSTTHRLTAADQSDLLSAFRVWLESRAHEYSDMAEQLAASISPVADRLAGALILLKGMNFSVTDLAGGRFGVNSKKSDKRNLLIMYAFGLLYDLPSDMIMGFPSSFSARTSVNF